MNWSEFFAMGGYGTYVWTSYLFAAIILILNAILPLRRAKTVYKMLREFLALTKQTK